MCKRDTQPSAAFFYLFHSITFSHIFVGYFLFMLSLYRSTIPKSSDFGSRYCPCQIFFVILQRFLKKSYVQGFR